MEYYYLVASLPMLALGTAPAMDSDVFLSECRQHLRPEDVEAVTWALSPDGPAPHPAAQRWQDYETQLRNAIARQRARRRGRDPAAHLHAHDGFEPTLESAVDDAFGSPTPMDRERALDTLRWEAIDRLRGIDAFGLPSVLAYALQLRIAERWVIIQGEDGGERADALVNMPKGGTTGTDDTEATATAAENNQ